MSQSPMNRAAAAAPQPATVWQMLPFCLRLPLRFGPLVFLGSLALAAVLASLVLGAFGLVFKGILIFLGLRYGFNLLELLSRGRFEGESPNFSVWGGSDRRPGKLALVLALFIVLGGLLGNLVLDRRIAHDTKTQDALVRLYEAQNAESLQVLRREHEALAAARAAAVAERERQRARQQAAAPAEGEEGAEGESALELSPADLESEFTARALPSREEMVQAARPQTFAAAWFSLLPAWYWLVAALTSLLLPAAALVIATEDAFFRSLNPLNVARFVGAMGAEYFTLWGLFLLIAGVRHAVLVMGTGWPTVVAFPIELTLATYLFWVLCALMGYALYRHHEALGHEVEFDFETQQRAGGVEAIARAGSTERALRAQQPTDPFERRVHELLADGKIDAAIDVVRDEMRYDRLDAPLNLRLHALLQRQGQREAILAHGPQLLRALARAERGKDLLATLQDLRKLDPAVELPDGVGTAAAAEAALAKGDAASATQLLKGFDKRWPEHPEAPRVYFLGARLMSEHGRDHDRAARLLQGLLARFPEHAVVAEAQQYLQVLERMRRPGVA